MKKALLIIAIVIVIVLIGGVCTSIVLNATQKIENPIATIKIQGYDEAIVVELYPEYAENTVANFITLANNGFYNGLKIHRVEETLIQGGDSSGDGTGSPSLSDLDKSIEKGSDADDYYAIPGEFERGVIGMARGDYTSYSSSLKEESYNSAGSQFFIMTQALPSLNGNYTGFGKVVSGLDTTVDSISKVETAVDESTDEETGEVTKTETNRPATDVIIESVTVDTHGVEYGKPVTNEIFDLYSWYVSQGLISQ